MNSVPSGSNLYSRSSQDASLFSDIMRGPNGSPILLPGPSSPSYTTSSSQVPQSNGSYQNSYVMGVETTAINSMSFVNNATTPTIPQHKPKIKINTVSTHHLIQNHSRCLAGTIPQTPTTRFSNPTTLAASAMKRLVLLPALLP